MQLPQLIIFGVVLLAQSFLVQSIFLPWSKSKNETTDGFRISKTLIDLNKKYNTFGGKLLERLKNTTRQVSLDQRCFGANDMPISVSFHKSHPYAYFETGKKFLHIRGMMPSILAGILDYCCQGGVDKVKFAKLLRTPLEAEDHFLSEKVNEYDFTFPIHAPAGTRSFRDHPFIPLVRAPSVVLLAYDGNERTTKTHAIATTILKAWPIMVFILLTATFSGIIIWFLVSNMMHAYMIATVAWRNRRLSILPRSKDVWNSPEKNSTLMTRLYRLSDPCSTCLWLAVARSWIFMPKSVNNQ